MSMYFKLNKRDELKAEIANTVFNILQNPKYSALAVGTEFKTEVLAEVGGHLDHYLDRSKAKNVDRILASVKDKLMKAPEFTFNHEQDTGTIVFTYHEEQENKECTRCNGNGFIADGQFKRITCPKCKDENWGF